MYNKPSVSWQTLVSKKEKQCENPSLRADTPDPSVVRLPPWPYHYSLFPAARSVHLFTYSTKANLVRAPAAQAHYTAAEDSPAQPGGPFKYTLCPCMAGRVQNSGAQGGGETV